MPCRTQVEPFVAAPGPFLSPFLVLKVMIWIQPAVIFLSDLIFSVGFAEGLAMIVRSVDKSAHHKRFGWI